MKRITIMALAALVISLGLAGYTIVQAERHMTYLQGLLKEQDKAIDAIEAALIRQGESLEKLTPASAKGLPQTIPVVPSYQQPWSQPITVSEPTSQIVEYQRLQEERKRANDAYDLERRMKGLEEQARKLERCMKFSGFC